MAESMICAIACLRILGFCHVGRVVGGGVGEERMRCKGDQISGDIWGGWMNAARAVQNENTSGGDSIPPEEEEVRGPETMRRRGRPKLDDVFLSSRDAFGPFCPGLPLLGFHSTTPYGVQFLLRISSGIWNVYNSKQLGTISPGLQIALVIPIPQSKTLVLKASGSILHHSSPTLWSSLVRT